MPKIPQDVADRAKAKWEQMYSGGYRLDQVLLWQDNDLSSAEIAKQRLLAIVNRDRITNECGFWELRWPRISCLWPSFSFLSSASAEELKEFNRDRKLHARWIVRR